MGKAKPLGSNNESTHKSPRLFITTDTTAGGMEQPSVPRRSKYEKTLSKTIEGVMTASPPHPHTARHEYSPTRDEMAADISMASEKVRAPKRRRANDE